MKLTNQFSTQFGKGKGSRRSDPESDRRRMREAGVPESDLPDTVIFYDTGDGYGGELITYHKKNKQFCFYPYGWHIDDSIEYEQGVPCTPEQAIGIVAGCSHNVEQKLPAIRRIAKLARIDVSALTNQGTRCYLNEEDHTILKVEQCIWYQRDAQNHLWIRAEYRMGQYYNNPSAFVMIEYDATAERIVKRLSEQESSK